MRGPILLAVGLLAVVGLAGAAPAARAAPAVGVAVTSLTTHGVDAATVPGFAKSLSGGLAAGGLNVVGLNKVQTALKSHAGLQGCETAVCLKRIGALLQVPLCGKATVEASGTTTFRIEVVLTAVVTGKQAARVERRCELCNLKEAREALSQAAADAAGKAARVPGLVPPSRKVRTSPARRARHGRSTPVHPRFGVVDRGKPLRRWGLVGMVTGVAALIPGIVLLVIHGKDTGDEPPASDRHRWNTQVGGMVLAAAGAALLTAGTTMVILGLLRRKTSVPIVSFGWDPKTRGAMVAGRLRF